MSEGNNTVEEQETGEEGIEERKIYMCLSCGRTFGKSELEIFGRSASTIRCPYCGYNIVIKVRIFKGSSITAV
ncbi:RNA polymerase Rbp10 [Caldivirga maquilingensis IC-167]|uniref:DNA-directed RNA polymerase subunit Rpo12 n=1 Tax=Caldivirga maquilingensis (strain ATCC 700844 / DSM 13496 / JCM 10307 / IC-167) TaxID=397948 RepID=A8MAQ4_CALMQ|nr:RNA polymerase Rbp10 [Caldivirga maquilingensis]ABW01090.1 RNA polymerase Rbp10 [Caldivirga maquilingensis IC-167]